MTQRKSETIVYLSLILDNGKSVIVMYPDNLTETILEECNDCMESGGIWFVGNYTDVTAMIMGERIDQINMSRVIGIR